jgi:hypothetical protein
MDVRIAITFKTDHGWGQGVESQLTFDWSSRRSLDQALDDGVQVSNVLSNDVDFPLNVLSLL